MWLWPVAENAASFAFQQPTLTHSTHWHKDAASSLNCLLSGLWTSALSVLFVAAVFSRLIPAASLRYKVLLSSDAKKKKKNLLLTVLLSFSFSIFLTPATIREDEHNTQAPVNNVTQTKHSQTTRWWFACQLLSLYRNQSRRQLLGINPVLNIGVCTDKLRQTVTFYAKLRKINTSKPDREESLWRDFIISHAQYSISYAAIKCEEF